MDRTEELLREAQAHVERLCRGKPYRLKITVEMIDQDVWLVGLIKYENISGTLQQARVLVGQEAGLEPIFCDGSGARTNVIAPVAGGCPTLASALETFNRSLAKVQP